MRWRRLVLAVAAGAIITATLVAVVPLAVDDWIQDAVAIVLPQAVPDRAYWMITRALTVALIALPGLIVAVVIAATGRRPAPNRCRACGYDLAGNTSARCPECGEAC